MTYAAGCLCCVFLHVLQAIRLDAVVEQQHCSGTVVGGCLQEHAAQQSFTHQPALMLLVWRAAKLDAAQEIHCFLLLLSPCAA